MLAVLLALGSAFAYGSSDFLAGLWSRRMSYALAGAVSQVTAALVSVIVSVVIGGRPSGAALEWAAVAGLGGGLGTLALYRGLACGKISVVAPLAGIVSAGLPALVGLALGERPARVAIVGLVLALPAVWLVSGASGPGPSEEEHRTHSVGAENIVDGLLAGVGFAVMFIGLQRAGRGSSLWPTALEQAVSAVPVLAFYGWTVARRPAPVASGSGWLGWAGVPIAVGVLVSLAVTLYFLATRLGMLTIVAVLTSLYPAVTVAMARWVLAEPIGPRRGVGLVLAGLSVALISTG